MYFGGCAMLDMTTWIHSVWLVAMNFVYDVINLWSEYGNAYLRNWYTWYSVDAWMLAGLRLDVLLVLTHTYSLQSLWTVTSSTLRLWGAFCYPHFWSSGWCHDDVMMMENQTLYQEHFPEKSYSCLLPELTLLRNVRRLLIYSPTRMPDSRRLD